MSTAQRAAPLGVAIIGCGRIGELRGHIAAAHPCVSFMACADRDGTRAAQVAQQLGAQFHGADNLAAISRPEVGAVIVSSAEDAHVEPVLQALALGKPVLCEKPIGLSLAAADEVLEAIDRYGGAVRYGYSRRFRHRYLRAKEQVVQGRLGRIVGGHGRANPAIVVGGANPLPSGVKDPLPFVVVAWEDTKSDGRPGIYGRRLLLALE